MLKILEVITRDEQIYKNIKFKKVKWQKTRIDLLKTKNLHL